MRPLVPFVVIVALLAFAASAVADHAPIEEATGELGLGDGVEDPELLETQEDEEVGVSVGSLLSDAGGFLQSVGGVLETGVTQAGVLAASALGTAGDAIATVFAASGDALIWSIGGVYTLITGTVTAGFEGVVALVTGAWALLASLATSAALGRPTAMSQSAWVGTVAVGATAASAAGHFGLWNLLRRFGWIGAGLPLFSRIEKDDLLDHPLRSEIYDVIKASPGIHISQLARTVDAGWGTTIHHLRKLKENDMVAVRMVNNQKCYFINGGGTGRDTWGAISHLKNETARRIAEFVYAHPLIAVTDVSKRLGVSASLVSHHVAKLTRAGVLEKVRDGRFIRLAVTKAASTTMFPAQTSVAQPAEQPLAA